MLVKIRNIGINTDHVSMLAVKDKTLVVDFAYSKPEGPVFLAFDFDNADEAQSEFDRIDSLHNYTPVTQ